MLKRGIATFTLDTGRCPKWLFERMVRLSREIIFIITAEYGAQEFIKRLADPVWFQSLGTVLAFDWNASGLTTTLTAALKEALRGQERKLGIFICGGKGRTSRKTPGQIEFWSKEIALTNKQTQDLIISSKLAAKVDSALVQDGYQIYHHAFFFTKKGDWTVIQQGMNLESQTARRYHWHRDSQQTNANLHQTFDFINEPHTGIAAQKRHRLVVNLTAQASSQNRRLTTELTQTSFSAIKKDIDILRRHFSQLVKTIALRSRGVEVVGLKLEPREFHSHPVVDENFFDSPYLNKILKKVCSLKPVDYQSLLAITGVGPKTIRALSLIAEIIYGAPPSYLDPARYSFAYGGKDATPYPIDQATYDKTIRFFRKVVQQTELLAAEKLKILKRLHAS